MYFTISNMVTIKNKNNEKHNYDEYKNTIQENKRI